jgi:two-component system chemotaxis sensor kinase CheA
VDDSELLVDFVEEAREHLGDIEIQLLQIEAMGAAIDDNLVNTVFRAIHSVKGAAGFLGLEQINAVSHRLEDVLGKVRDKRLVPDPYNVDVMLKAADRLKSMIEDIGASNSRDNTEICDKLDAILTGLLVTTSTPSLTNEPADDELAAKPRAKRAPRKTATEKPTAKKMTEAENRNTGSASQPKTPAPKQRKTRQSTSSLANDKAVSDRVSDSLDSIDAAMADAEINLAQPGTRVSSNDPPATTTPSDAHAAKASTGDSTIRVSVRVLDRLMNLAGELVLSRNQLMQSITADRAIRARDSGGRHASEAPSKVDAIAQGLDQVTSELQETIMQTRMQPIGNVFAKFPRVIRDLSSSLGKEIVLQTEGNEVETDKTIIEAIADPLTHLVRNSCDHGIERPEVRKAAGKPPTGTVVLKAYHQAGKVMIQIIDDGAGINPEVLKAKAIEKGILTAEAAERLNDRDAVNLIFAPGFSTAAAITAVSGRGVGMDVVRTNIEKIGGSVAVTSRLGKGSTVDITLPLTLAIVPSMIVTVGGRPYALPQSGIVELIQPDGKEKSIGYAGSAEVLRLRGSLLPLIRMKDLLKVRTDIASENDDTAQESSECQLVVVESGQHQFAVAVDQIAKKSSSNHSVGIYLTSACWPDRRSLEMDAWH